MPSLPPSQCVELGCKAKPNKGSSLCEAHAPSVMVTQDRREFNRKYSDSAWDSIRNRQLSTQPLCQSCLVEDRVTQANHVDHVFPWRQLGNYAFRQNVFQSLCAECHGIKTGMERKGVFLHYLQGEVKEYCIHDYREIYESTT